MAGTAHLSQSVKTVASDMFMQTAYFFLVFHFPTCGSRCIHTPQHVTIPQRQIRFRVRPPSRGGQVKAGSGEHGAGSKEEYHSSLHAPSSSPESPLGSRQLQER